MKHIQYEWTPDLAIHIKDLYSFKRGILVDMNVMAYSRLPSVWFYNDYARDALLIKK